MPISDGRYVLPGNGTNRPLTADTSGCIKALIPEVRWAKGKNSSHDQHRVRLAMCMKVVRCVWLAIGLLLCLPSGGAQARQLTFEDRVKAQEAIERVYYS